MSKENSPALLTGGFSLLATSISMKYAQGSFITVPSRESLRGVHPTAQAIYMWLCSYANETGQCFPSRKRIASDAGCSETTVDNMLALLVEKGLLNKKQRAYDGTQLTNLYTVLIVPPLPRGGTPPPTSYPTPSHEARTNSIHLTQSKQHGGSEDGIREVREVSESEEERVARPKRDTGYKAVFALFSVKPQGWMSHKPQIESARRLLKDKGLPQVKKALEFYKEHKEDPYMVEIHTPFDLEAKWSKLISKAKKV